MTRFITALAATISLAIFPKTTYGAAVGQNLGSDKALVDQYVKNPNGYPISKAGMDYSNIWRPLTPAKLRIFDSTNAILEIGMYQLGGHYTGDEVVKEIKQYEAGGFKVCGVFLYREEWLKGGHNSVHSEDWRILSLPEITSIREAIKSAKLKSANIKLYQLLGATGNKEFPSLNNDIKNFLKENFDGVGTECHIGMEKSARQRPRLDSMVAIAKWTKDNGKTAFLFMGGMPSTYTNLPAAQNTYAYLWSQMAKVGVDKKSPHMIYWRQAARPGNEVPENESTLTQQQAWLIGQVK